MNPLWIFVASVGALIVVRASDRVRERLHDARFGALARELRMNYSPIDRFGLAARLRASPAWRGRSTGLRVRDVLYGARGGERRFVATAERRATADGPTVPCVIACAERADGSFEEVAAAIADGRDASHADYRAQLHAWPEPAEATRS